MTSSTTRIQIGNNVHKKSSFNKNKHLSPLQHLRPRRNNLLDLPDVILSSIFNQIKLDKQDNIRKTCRRFLQLTNNSQKHKIKKNVNRQMTSNEKALSRAESTKTVLLIATTYYSLQLNYSYLFNRLILQIFHVPLERISNDFNFDQVRKCLLKFYQIAYADLNNVNSVRCEWTVNKLNFCTLISLLNKFQSAKRAISLVSPNHVRIQYELIGTWLTVCWTCMQSKMRFQNSEGYYLLTIFAHLLHRQLCERTLCTAWDTSDRVFVYGRNSKKIKWKTICSANIFGSRKIMKILLNGDIDIETIMKHDCCAFIDVTCSEATKWGLEKIQTFHLG